MTEISVNRVYAAIKQSLTEKMIDRDLRYWRFTMVYPKRRISPSLSLKMLKLESFKVLSLLPEYIYWNRINVISLLFSGDTFPQFSSCHQFV